MSKSLNETVHFQFKKREEVNTKAKRKETKKGCRRQEERSPPDQLIGHVVSRKKRVSVNRLQSNCGEEKRQFLPDVPESLR